MGGCCCRGKKDGDVVSAGRERRGLLQNEDGMEEEEENEEDRNRTDSNQQRIIRRIDDPNGPDHAPDGNGHDRSRDVNPMPADMLRILSEAYAAQMEANLKAEDAMIRQVERMTIIERLPSTTCTSTSIVNLSEAQKECSICFEDYKEQDEIRFLPCMHFYHQKCIDDWLQRQLTCPICGDELQTQLGDFIDRTELYS